MKRNTQNAIPSDEEFAHAEAVMRERLKNEERIRKKIHLRCGSSAIYHDTWVWLSRKSGLGINLFVKKEEQIETKEADSLKEIISDIITQSEGIEQFRVSIESDERIQKEFNGDYYKRFR